MNCCNHQCNEGRNCPARVWCEEDAWKDPGAQRFVAVCVLATIAACVLAVFA